MDLVFIAQPNLVTESGLHSSLKSNHHHQIKPAKFNSNVLYAPLYERKVLHYKLVNFECIQGAISNYDFEKPFIIIMWIKRN